MKSLNSEQSARLRSVLKNFGIILIIGFIYFVFVKLTNLGIPCIFNLITGLHCPGCGISRMFLSLASLDFKSAFGYNAYIMTVGPIALIFVIRHYVLYILKGQKNSGKFETVLLIIAFVLMIIFSILRNLPQFAFLAP